jgi:hypothetical protein
MAEITVRLLAGDDEERSLSLSREFSSDVARLSGVVSRAPPPAAPELGKKGDPITLGAIVIAAASGGALTALIALLILPFADAFAKHSALPPRTLDEDFEMDANIGLYWC